MRHLSLVDDTARADDDFPPGWAEFEAARQRFFSLLATQAAPLTLVTADKAEEPGTATS
jgi:hypothetical protein